MSDDVVEQVDEEYEKLINGEPVDYDIASMYFKENNGFLLSKGPNMRKIGLCVRDVGIDVMFFESTDDGLVKKVDSEGFAVDTQTKHRLTEMAKNANDEFRKSLLDEDAEEQEDEEKDLDYLG